ncbi:MAG: hypothetical protein HWE27_15910 [Gammaproteobacteria bacterium]|nr:hypothetical protein [Gammaproteobacteria bacterium]
MNRIFLFTVALFSSLVSADIYFKPANKSEGSYYIACDSCNSKADFLEKAESAALELNHTDVSDSMIFVVVNSTDEAFKTVRVTNALSDISSKLRKNRRFDKTYFESFLSKKRTFNAVYKYEPLSFYLTDGSYSAYSNWLNVVDTFDNGFANVTRSWTDEPDFVGSMRDEINDIIKEQDLNPFNFTHAPLSINVLTPNMEVVNLSATSLSRNPDWAVNLVFHEQQIYGAQGNQLHLIDEYNESLTCFASEEFEFCRELIPGTNIAVGDAIFRLRVFGTGNPTLPPGCNLYTNNCGKIEFSQFF